MGPAFQLSRSLVRSNCKTGEKEGVALGEEGDPGAAG